MPRPLPPSIMPGVLRWLLCGTHPGPRARRVVPVLVGTAVLAVFGTVLVALTPAITGNGSMQALYVLFVVIVLKLPLIAVLWWLIARNPEWPGTRPTWGPKEQQEILAYLEGEARRVADLPDAEPRLAYLSGEAWHVADRLEGEAKVDALTVALRIDTIASRARRERRSRP